MTISEVVVRDGVIEDLDEVNELLIRVKEDLKNKGSDIWQCGHYPNKSYLEEDLKNGALVATIEGKIVGYIAYKNFDPKNIFESDDLWEKYKKKIPIDYSNLLYLARLMVDPYTQNGGIGQKILLALEEKIKDKSGFIFFVHLSNEKGCHIYQKLDYQNLGIFEFKRGLRYTFLKRF